MRLIIDGREYEFDDSFLVQRWYEMTEQYINPAREEAKKYTDLRLAAKAALRLRLSAILKAFAQIFHVDDWRTLQPKRGEDMLVKLHQYVTILLRAEAQNLELELESVESVESDDTGISGGDSPTRLTLSRARFAGGQTLYQRSDTGGALNNATGPDTPALPEAPGGGLVYHADASEVFERRAI